MEHIINKAMLQLCDTGDDIIINGKECIFISALKESVAVKNYESISIEINYKDIKSLEYNKKRVPYIHNDIDGSTEYGYINSK